MRPAKSHSTRKNAASEAEQVFEAVHQVMHLFRSRHYSVLRDTPHDITHLEGKLLSYFSDHPGDSLRDLVEHSGKDKSQLARLIGELKKKNLLEGRSDASDRRTVRLHLTPQGEEIHQLLEQQLHKYARIAVQDLSGDERGQLIKLLDKVRTSLETSSGSSAEKPDDCPQSVSRPGKKPSA